MGHATPENRGGGVYVVDKMSTNATGRTKGLSRSVLTFVSKPVNFVNGPLTKLTAGSIADPGELGLVRAGARE